MHRFSRFPSPGLMLWVAAMLGAAPALAQQADSPSSLLELERRGSNGDGQAAFSLGEIYADGKGVPKDVNKAKKWLEKAAELDYGVIDVANRYWAGRGVPNDIDRAAYWYQRAGCGIAGYQLGKMYELGIGVAQDYAKAADCYRQGVRASAHARLGLARLTERGLGLPRDEVAAMRSYRDAAEGEIGDVAFEIAMNYSQGRGVSADEAQASRWWQASATYHNGLAARNLASNFLSGTGVPRAALAAYVWSSLVTDIDHYAMGERDRLAAQSSPDQLKWGVGIVESLQATKKVFGAFYGSMDPVIYMSEMELRAAASRNDVHALFSLAYRLENGQGMESNPAEAIELYRKLVVEARADMYAALGKEEVGHGNQIVAMDWYRGAATLGSVDAQYRLGVAFRYGEAGQKDLFEACKWFILASDANPSARTRVSEMKAELTEEQFAAAQDQAAEIRNSFDR